MCHLESFHVPPVVCIPQNILNEVINYPGSLAFNNICDVSNSFYDEDSLVINFSSSFRVNPVKS